jgi:hypothetical protein
MKTTLPARRIDLGGADFDVLLWAGLGRSYKFIQKKTGFSFSQIAYRLTKASLKIGAYRNGEGPAAELIDAAIMARVETQLRRELNLTND